MFSFDFMRLSLALIVIFCHTGSITGLYKDPNLIINNYIYTGGNLAVFIFFFISGFVITSSYLYSKSWQDFALKRILRIYPGFWVCLVIGSFLVVPFLFAGTSFEMQTQYFSKNFSALSVTCTPTDSSLPSQSNCLNDPVWTLVYELTAYLIAMLLGVFGLLRNKIFLISSFVIITILYLLRVSSLDVHIFLYSIGKDYLTELIPFLSWFLAGSIFFNFKEKLSMNWNTAYFCILGLFISLIPSFIRTFQTQIILNFGVEFFEPIAKIGYFIPQIFPIVAPLLGGYLILFLANKLPLKNWKSWVGDLSYGTYIYGWMIQRVLFELKIQQISVVLYILMSMFLALIMGFLSWNLVEKPMMSWYKKSRNRFIKRKV